MNGDRQQTEAVIPGMRFPLLDAIRGGAVLMVLIYHCLFWAVGSTHLPYRHGVRDFEAHPELTAMAPLTFGWAGVAIFFVVSGFCIHLSFLNCERWGYFFWKRFWRIYPPYLAALFLFFVMDSAAGQLRDEAEFQLITHALLVHNFWSETHFGINPSFWSIAVEAQLYVIYPILVFFVAKIRLVDIVDWCICARSCA